MLPRVNHIVHSCLPPLGRRGMLSAVLAAVLCLFVCCSAMGAYQQQWTQYQRYSSHTGSLPLSSDPQYSQASATAFTTLGAGSDLQWLIDTRHNGAGSNVRASMAAVTNAGTLLLAQPLAPGNTTLTLANFNPNRNYAGDLAWVDEYPANRAWAASTYYALGQCVRATAIVGYYYTCTAAGESGTTPPTTAGWPTTVGNNVTDSGVTWTCHVGGEYLGVISAPANPSFTVATAPQYLHPAGSKVFVTPTATLAAQLNTTDVTNTQLTLTPSTIGKVHVGDILVVGLPGGSTTECLGPVLTVDRTGTTNIVTFTYPYANNHPITDQVQISPYRMDSVTAGDVLTYADQSLSVSISRTLTDPTSSGSATTWLESTPWYDNSTQSLSNPATTTLLFFTQITPYFTDNNGAPLQNFRTDGGGGQEIHVGFRTNDASVQNPSDLLTSPIYIYGYLTDTGQLGIRRMAINSSALDANNFIANTAANSTTIPTPGGYLLANGVQLALALTPSADGAYTTATLYYQVADSSGNFTSGFSGYTTVGTYKLPSGLQDPTSVYTDSALPSAVYPFIQGDSLTNAKSFAFMAGQLSLYQTNPIAGGALDINSRSLQLNHPECFNTGDLIDIISASDPSASVRDTARITGISGNVVSFTTNLPGGTLGNNYPIGAIIRAGQPGRPTTYVGDDAGELRAVNPETLETYSSASNAPEQDWLQTGDDYLGAIVGAPAVDGDLGRVYVTSLSGRLFAFLQNGQLAWVYPALNFPALGPIQAAPVVDDAGNIYFAAGSGSGAYTSVVTWTATTVYSLGQAIYPTTPNGFYYQCTTPGSSAATIPVWPTTIGATITDGSAIWTAYPVGCQVYAITPDGTPMLNGNGNPLMYVPGHLQNTTTPDTPQIVGLALYRLSTADPGAGAGTPPASPTGSATLRIVVTAQVKNNSGGNDYGMVYSLNNLLGEAGFYKTGPLRASPVIGSYTDPNGKAHHTIYIGDESGKIYALYEQETGGGGLYSRWVQLDQNNNLTDYQVPTLLNSSGKSSPVRATAAVSDIGTTLFVADSAGNLYDITAQWPDTDKTGTTTYEQIYHPTTNLPVTYATMQNNAAAQPWQHTTNYNVGQAVLPPAPNGFYYQCVKLGQSAGTPPVTWPLSVGAQLIDGSVIWTTIAVNAETPAGPLTLDGAGNLLFCTEQGSVYDCSPANFTTAGAPVQPWWRWNTLSNAGMSIAAPLHTAPALWTTAAGVPLVMVGGDDGLVYAITGGAGSSSGTQLPTNPGVAVPDTFWPFFQRDEWREGSLRLSHFSNPGPLQPSLRWFAPMTSALASSSVVTDRTPDGKPWVLQGTKEGRLYAYDASTGQQKITKGQNFANTETGIGYVPLSGDGPVLGTPAVDSLVNPAEIIVPTFGGSISAVNLSGQEIANTRAQGLLGNFLASPVISNDGTIYAATMDAPHTTGTYAPAAPTFTAPQTLASQANLTYTVPANTLSYITHVRIYVQNAGTLSVYNGTQQIFSQAYPAGTPPVGTTQNSAAAAWTAKTAYTLGEAVNPPTPNGFYYICTIAGTSATTAPVWPTTAGATVNDGGTTGGVTWTAFALARYLDIDLGMLATQVVWQNTDTTSAVISAFEVYAAGDVSQVLPGTAATTSVHIISTDASNNTASPFAGAVNTVIYPAANPPVSGPLFINYAVLKFAAGNTATTGTLSAVGADGRTYPIQTIGIVLGQPNNPDNSYVIPINRRVSQLIWTPLSAGSLLVEIDVYQRDFTNTGGRVFAFKSDLTPLWHYPSSGCMEPIQASPVIGATGTTYATDTVYVATSAGQVLALSGASISNNTISTGWTRDVYNPLTAAPVLVKDSTGANTYLLLGDAGGDLHMLNGASGANHLGWPVVHLNEVFGNSAAVTAEHKAYLISSGGHEFKVDLSAANENLLSPAPTPVTASNTAPGNTWEQATMTYDGLHNLLAFTGHLVVAPALTAGQTVNFGLRYGSDAPFASIAVSQTQLGLYAGGSAVQLPLTTAPDLSQGIDLALTVLPNAVSGGNATVSAYYRLPNGNFIDIGAFAVSDTASVGGLPALYPFIQAVQGTGQPYTVTPSNVTLFALAQYLNNLNTSVTSSPVIDATGRLFVGADNGLLYCLAPDSTSILWSYSPWRNITSTTLAKNVAGGTQTLPVASVLGFSIGDPVEVVQPDGSNPQSLGAITNITPATGAVQTTLTTSVPIAGNVRSLPLVSVTGVNVGDAVNILPYADPALSAPPQSVHFLGNVAKVDTTGNTVTLDRDITQFDMMGTGTANTSYAGNADPTQASTVYIGSTLGTLQVSQGPASFRYAGDIVRISVHQTMPMRTSPSIGPLQTLYIGADDALLYAIGPIGPAGLPAALPSIPNQVNEDVWPTWRHDDQRAGFVNRYGVTQPGFIYDQSTKQFTTSVRWSNPTSTTLDSSPALGYADNGNPQGIMYIGTSSDVDGQGNFLQGGSLLALDANLGGTLWRFDDTGNMGQVYSSPAVVDIDNSGTQDPSQLQELVIVGTEEPERAVSANLLGAIVLDHAGNEVWLRPSVLDGSTGINEAKATRSPLLPPPPDQVVALLVDDASSFSVGMQVFLTDYGTGTHQEIAGTVASITQDIPTGWWVIRLTTSFNATQPHPFAVLLNGLWTYNSTVHSQATQQGHIYAVDRNGNLQWKFPEDGNDPINMVHASVAVTSHQVKQGDISSTVIYCVSRTGMIYALDLNGNELWSHYITLPASDAAGTNIVETGQIDVTSSPVLDANGSHLYISVSFINSPNGYLVAIDNNANDDSTRQLWVRQVTGAVTGTPAYASDNTLGSRLYVGTDLGTDATGNNLGGMLYCIDATSGLETTTGTTAVGPLSSWQLGTTIPAAPLGPIAGSPAMVPSTEQTRVSNPTIVDSGSTGNKPKIHLTSANGLLAGMRVQLNWANGTQRWCIYSLVANGGGEDVTLYNPSASNLTNVLPKQIDSLVTDEQMLVVGSRDGNVYVTTEQLTPIGFFPTGGPIVASPAISTETSIIGTGVRSYTAYIGSYDHYLYALTLAPVMPDANNAAITQPVVTMRWQAYLYESIDSSPAIGLVAADTSPQALLYQAGGDQCVYCFPGNNVINPPPPQYQPPSTLQIRKTAVNIGAKDPQTGQSFDPKYTWWKFTVTVRNTGQSPITGVKIYDTLPPELCAKAIAPDNTPPPPLCTGLHADEWASNPPTNQGSTAAPQWQLEWSNNAAGLPGAGFTLNPYNPATNLTTLQPESDYMRVFTFYAAIQASTRTYANQGTKMIVTANNPAVMVSPRPATDPPYVPDVRYAHIGDTLYLQLLNIPIPFDTGNTGSENQIYALGQATQGYPNDQQTVPLEVHSTTPVSNDWSGGNHSFKLHFYYGAPRFASSDMNTTPPPPGPPVVGQLSWYAGGTDKRALSPWNVRDPETGEPVLKFNYTLTPHPTSRQEARTRMVNLVPPFATPLLGLANAGITVSLTPQARRYDRLSAPVAVVDSQVASYAWRVTMQQGESQLGDNIEWGPELAYEDRVLLGTVKSVSNSGTTATITIDDGSKANWQQRWSAQYQCQQTNTPSPTLLPNTFYHHIVVLGSQGVEAYVTSVNLANGQFTCNILTNGAQNAGLNVGDQVRDEWSPDVAITNPVNVQPYTTNTQSTTTQANMTDRFSLGDNCAPGNDANNDTFMVQNLSSTWSMSTTQPNYRFQVGLIDLRNAQASSYNWNSYMDTQTAFGVPTPTWEDWTDFRYDPYLENHITLNPDALETPGGIGLYNAESAHIRLDRAVPFNQAPTITPPSAGNMPTSNTPNSSDATFYAGQLEAANMPNCHYDTNAKVLYLDLNGNGKYDQGIDAVLNDINGNGQLDPGEFFYIDTKNSGYYQPGDPVVALDNHSLRIYLDMLGNGVYLPGDPIYEYNYITDSSVNSNGIRTPATTQDLDFAAWGVGVDSTFNPLLDSRNSSLYTYSPDPLLHRLGVQTQEQITLPDSVIDYGSQPFISTSGQPLAPPSLRNVGNLTLFGQSLTPATTFAVGNSAGVQQGGPSALSRTGSSPVYFDPTAKMVVARNGWETFPLFLQCQLTSNQLTLPKNPVGVSSQLGRHLDVVSGATPIIQPLGNSNSIPLYPASGNYTGDVVATAGDSLTSQTPTDSALISMRVVPSDISRVLTPPLPQAPLPIDYSQQHTPAMKDWTLNLTGSTSWPTALLLTNRTALNPNEPDMPGVVVSSDTPMLSDTEQVPIPSAQMMPSDKTDANLWYRRVKHLMTALTVPLTTVYGPPTTINLYIPQGYWNVVRLTDGTTTDMTTSDFVILRMKPQPGATPNLPVITGRVLGKGNDASGYYLTIDPVVSPYNATWPTNSVVEIFSHPWVPLFNIQGLNQKRAVLDDPGNPTGGPYPLRCVQPSFAQDTAGNNWLTWAVSADRTITVNGQVNHIPTSYLLYKQFNPDRPLDNQALWIGTPDTPVSPGGPVIYPDRQHPQLLPNVNNLGALAFYDIGTGNTRQMMYATTAQPLTGAPTWTVDLPLSVINWSFSSAANPQTWADSNGNGGAESPMTHVNLIFQASGADNNIDLYYARLQVNPQALSILPLALPGTSVAGPTSDGQGHVIENFTNTGNGVFTGGQNLAWASGLLITVNGQNLPALAINDVQREYQVTATLPGNNQVTLSVDPYRGIVHVVNGTVTTITFTGQPRLQRLTTHQSPDVDPMVSVERYRYIDTSVNPNGVPFYGPVNGTSPTLQTSPRVWLFWVRHNEDGLGSRAYYRTWRLNTTNTNGPRLDVESRGLNSNETASNTWNIDMSERMLPMDVLAPDGSLFITRQSATINSPQAGLWVLSTNSRSTWPPYPDPSVLTTQYTVHDLYLQSLNVPSPDLYGNPQ